LNRSDAVWKYATQYGIPKMIVVNAFDKDETDFVKTAKVILGHTLYSDSWLEV